MYLRRIDSISKVVPFPVRYVGNQVFALPQRMDDQLDDINVLHFIVATDVVDLANASLMDDQIDSFTMILHIQPISDIPSFTVDRQRFVVQTIDDHQRDQLLREVIRTVVVGTARNCCRKSKRAVIGLYKKIRTCFRGAIGRGCMDRRFFREEQIRPIEGKIAVDLIRAYLMIADIAVLPASVHEHAGSYNIRLEENAGVFNAPVHMALCREIDYDIGLLFLKETIDTLPVADVKLTEAEVGSFHHRGQCAKIPSIGKFVNANDPIVRVFGQHVEDKIASDKTGSSSNDNVHDNLQ